jgi:hypothetical protein
VKKSERDKNIQNKKIWGFCGAFRCPAKITQKNHSVKFLEKIFSEIPKKVLTTNHRNRSGWRRSSWTRRPRAFSFFPA